MKDLEQIHNERINKHISLVRHFLEVFSSSELASELDFSFFDAQRIGKEHDKDKTKGGEVYDQYCVISYLYHCKLNDIECDLEYTPDLDDATREHINNNKHHPEYWDKNYDPDTAQVVVDFKDRDKTKGNSRDGRDMDDESIIEMCCDWAATGIERGNKGKDWADRCRKDSRYIFTDIQWEFIYKVLEIIED